MNFLILQYSCNKPESLKNLCKYFFVIVFTIYFSSHSNAQDFINREAELLKETLMKHRRALHQIPELSNREFKTAAYVKSELDKMNLEIKTGIAYTGVVAVLHTGNPGPVIALRADMDALPVEERSGESFASNTKTQYNGQEVFVSHACGHDAHVAILLGTAELMSRHRKKFKGTIVFIFQPAEEGPPEGENGGAKMMVEQGVLKNPKVDAIFGLHVNTHAELGTLLYKPGAFLAAADWFKVIIKGKQTHGAKPWNGIDPINISSQIIQAYQSIVARQTDLVKSPLVITVGKIHGGLRENIIPEVVEFGGTVRTLDSTIRIETQRSMKILAQNIAEGYGAQAQVEFTPRVPITYNDIDLVEKSIPALKKASGEDHLKATEWSTWSEDFAYYGKEVPSFFFNLGVMVPGSDPNKLGPHHTPEFKIDDSRLDIGVKAFCHLVMDYKK